MKVSKRVLLVTSAAPSQTPFSTWEKKPPLGVGFLLSMLRKAGHDVFFIDNYLGPSNFLESSYLQANGIDYVGIYVSTICFRDTQRMLYKIEHLRRCGQWHGKIIVGGPHTTVALDTIPAFVDHVVQGEGEQAIVDIVEGKVKDRVVRYPRIRDLDALPMPAWDLFTKLPYNWEVLWFPEKPTFTMTTSRGCPFRCAFCSVGAVWGKQYTSFSAARIVSDIEHLVERYGAKGIYFREDNFTLDRKRVVEFCKLLMERHIDICWACESRVDSLDRELLELMHKAGARGFYFGVESGSQRILDELHKGITVDQIRTSFRLCNEIGFKTAASIVVGLPQETEEDLAATDALLSEIKPTMTWQNVFVGIPSSKLYRHVIDRNLYEFIDDRGLVYLKGHNARVQKYYQNSWDADIPFHPESPAVSVIMAAHNADAFLQEAIHSILKQTYPNFELLVVDDASTDETAGILSRQEDPRIKIITNPEILGPAGARNKALAAARGTYIAIMDADDVSLPHRLETQIRFLESHPDHALVGSYAYQIDEAGRHESIIELQTEDDAIRRCLIRGNNFVHGSVMVRREVLLRAGGYNEAFTYAHDYELWLRLIESCRVANLPEPLYCWRSSSTQISTAKRAEQESFAERARREAAERADAERRRTDGVCSEARSLAMEGNLDAALEILNRRIDGRPNDALAHFCLGQLHERREERPSARACYVKAVSLEPGNISYLKHLAGFLLVEEGDTGKALAMYDRVLHLAPRDPETLLIRGNLAASNRQYDNAERFYRKVLDVDPGNGNAVENLETLSKLKEEDIRDTARTEASSVHKAHSRKTLETFKVTAIISAHNEGDVIYHVIGDLIHQGISVYLLDHRSTDNTVSEASPWLGKGLLHIETFPDDSHYAEENKSLYIWRDILKRKTELAAQLDADWFIHADADEFRESPWPGLTLREAFYVVDRLGYNAIDFELLNFRPIDNSFKPGKDVREFLKHYEGFEDYNTRQVKAWKNLRLQIDLITSGGHDICFEGRNVFPVRFIHRHYPIRSQQHGLQKVFHQRKNRFCDKERSMAWHIQYDHVLDENHNFLHDPAQLTCYDGDQVRTRLLTDGNRHRNNAKGGPRAPEKLVAAGYDTDKSPRYLGNYERFFLPFVNDPVRLLELGVFRGGSLYLWRDFFKNGFIVGLDATVASIDDSTGRIRIYQGLQQDKDLLDRLRRECAPDGFDVIIDDASHVGELTRISFWHLFEHHLKPGGLYVIEDWGTGYWDSFPDGKSYLPGENHVAGMVGFVKELIDECGMRDITHPMHGRNPQRESHIERMEVCSGQVFIIKKASPTAPFRTQTEAVPHPKGEPAAGALPIKRQRRENDQDARYHSNMATLYYGKGDRDEARNHFEKAVSLEPENASFRKNLGDFCYVAMKRPDVAVPHYEKALSLNPRDTETLLILGNIRAESGDFRQARECYLRALEIDPSNDLAGKMFDALEAKAEGPRERDPETLVREARCLARRGRTDRAVHLLEALLSACADHAAAHNDLGNLYCLLQKPDQALFHLERAVHLAPENIEYLRDLADAHLAEAGDLERALGLYNKALALRPDDIETLLRIGNICAAQNQFDDARYFYNRVLIVQPDHPQARENLAVLQGMAAGEAVPADSKSCPICGSVAHRKVTKQDHPYYSCTKCRAVFTPSIDPRVLVTENQGSESRHTPEMDQVRLSCLMQGAPFKLQTVVDFGCGNGEYGRFLMSKGIQCMNIDQDTKLQISDIPDESVDGINMVEVIEHLYDPNAYFKEFYRVLKPGGRLYVESSFVNGQDLQNWEYLSPAIGHCLVHSERSLVLLARMFDFGLHRFNAHCYLFNKPLGARRPDGLTGQTAAPTRDIEQQKAVSIVHACPATLESPTASASIIIPVFNQVEFTTRCLETLYANTPLDRVHEVIVVDNASTDGTGSFLEEARKRYPKLKILTNRENLLFAKACNQGADAAGGDYLVFLNNDTEPLAGWLDRALDRLESDDSIGILGIKLLYPDRTVQHSGIQFQRNAHSSYVVWPLHRHLRESADDPRVNVPQDVHAVTGACLFIRRDFFRRIGGFEERYGMYFEDTDLCFKARRGGKRVFYEPASVVIHHEGKSSASRAVINDLNIRAARLFFKIWKTELYSIELETLIDREEGKYAYLPDHFWPDEVSPEEIVRMHNLLSSFPSCHVHFGGSGDALLLLSAFYDSDPEQTIVSVSNSTGMMRSFFDAFPKLKKVYFIPFPKNYTWHYIARRFFKSSDICRGLGATPTTTADYREWNADLDIFKTYGIRQRPAWAVNFGKNRLAPRQVTLQPRGSLKGMVGSKRNALSTQDWARLLSYLEKKGVRPVIIGTPDEAAEYPSFGNAIDMRSYSFAEQMKLIAASDFFIGADSWGKTFSALAGIPTFVFHALRGDDLKDWKDASDHVFLDPWDEITVVKDFKEFRKSFDEAWRKRFLSAADLKIRWEGSQFVHHSLALVNRELCLRLIEGGCEVSIVPYERDQFTPKDEPRFKPIAERTKKPLTGPADIHVRHQWPPNFTPPPEGHWVIIQPWEFGSIPREWVRNMSAHVDEVWGPSHYVRDCYIRSGVPSERVFVVPNGVDIGLFNPDNAPYPLKTKKTFKFLFVGGTIQRKGIDILLDVYTKTFSSGDDVCLVIKDMGGQTFYKGQTAKDWIGRFQADPGSPEIEYIEHTLSDREIAGLYTACDCLAHPYRGEGFGLPIAEAMASGLPVIVTGHGAALDFCDDKTSYLIPAKEVRLPEKRIGEFETVDFPWLAEPDKEGLARLMRHAETHREEAAAKGALAAEFIRANFTWDHAAEAVRKRVRELRGKPIVRQKRQDDSTSRKEGIQQELLSIIIPVSGEASNLRSCVDAIRKWTPEPHEIVFVESQAASGVKKWLKKISQRDPLCRVVPSDGQPPVSDPVRLGLRSCTGKYVAVVEPDIVVTENWSAGMLEALESSADIGIMGPMMVNTEGRQNVPGTEGLSTSTLESHAAAFQKRNRHRRASADRLSRSCMIFKRILADDIGLTHEGPQREECVPDEWCLRSIYSGFQNLIAGDVLVYRSGNGDGQRISCGAAGERKLSAFAAKGGCLNADTPEDKRFLAMLTFREAEERFQQGDLRGATEACLEAIKLAPWKRGFYLALAEMLMQAKHFREALDLLRESDPGEQEERTVSLLGCIYEGLGEDDEAGRKADRALAMSTQSVRALNLKGVLAFKRGEMEQARSLFKKATDADPSWGEPFTNLGVLAWAEGRHAEALEFLERGFVLTPCQSDLADRYHAAAVSLGAIARAEAVFREARGLYPSSRTVAFLRIDLLMAQENYPSAMAEIESAMAAFDVDDGFIAAALEVRGKIGPLEIREKGGGETLSLCMIVKNEQSNLVRCLSSVRTAVDEIIVVDTGSTDRTKDIAAVFGAKVFDAPWSDDFAAARNIALAKATGNWILVLDADEAVSPADGLKLRGLLKHAASRKDSAGWLVTTRNYSPDMNLEGWTANNGSYGSQEAASGWFPSVKVRLFRNDPRIRYEGAVHEMVESSMKRAGLAWRSCDVIVHHYGTVTGGVGPSKGESYYRLGKKKIDQMGGDPRSVYELAVQASRLKKYGEAVALWHRYLASGCEENRHLAFLNLGHALIETGRYAEAREASLAALSVDPGLKEAGLNTALCEFYTGRYKEAVSRLEGLVAATPDYPPAFVLLSAARLLSGENGSAGEMAQTLRKRNINGAPFYQVYGQKLHEAGRNEDAETILEAARKSWSAMLASLGIPTTAENIGALMAAVHLDDARKTEAPPEKVTISTRSGSGRPCLSLCMIVKNEERSIARALESVKTLADEMIVVDTGSTDGTKEVAASFGAMVSDFPWTDDFASARNFSLSRATGDWILVIDADETVSSRDHERLRDLIAKSPAGTGGYDLTTRNYVVEANTAGWVANDGSYRDEEAGTGWYPNGKVRLFRNDPRIRFSGAVHELVEQSILGAGMTIAACNVPVHHTGKLDRESVLEKGKRYYLLGMKKIEESGGSPRAILELAIQAGELGRYDDAIRLWKRFLDGKPVQDVKLATVNLINACLNADRFDEALQEARKAASQANGTRELLLNCAAAEFFSGDLRKAIRMAEKILKKEPDYPPALTLLASAHALAGHAGKSTECLQRLHEKGLQLRSQILPVIEKLRKAGKKDEADRLLSLLDWQPRAACGPTPPSPDRSRQGSGCSVQR